MEMKMNKEKIVNKLIEKSHKSIDECNAIYDVLMKNFIVGRKNKEKRRYDFRSGFTKGNCRGFLHESGDSGGGKRRASYKL